jgi:hypothetical protein
MHVLKGPIAIRIGPRLRKDCGQGLGRLDGLRVAAEERFGFFQRCVTLLIQDQSADVFSREGGIVGFQFPELYDEANRIRRQATAQGQMDQLAMQFRNLGGEGQGSLQRLVSPINLRPSALDFRLRRELDNIRLAREDDKETDRGGRRILPMQLDQFVDGLSVSAEQS